MNTSLSNRPKTTRRSSWNQAPYHHELQPTAKQVAKTLDTVNERVEIRLLELAESIPYHDWGWAINTSRHDLIRLIRETNYSTIMALSRLFSTMPKDYWYDLRSRNFSGVWETLMNRLVELWYEVTRTISQQYNTTGYTVLIFPIECTKKAIPWPAPQSP